MEAPAGDVGGEAGDEAGEAAQAVIAEVVAVDVAAGVALLRLSAQAPGGASAGLRPLSVQKKAASLVDWMKVTAAGAAERRPGDQGVWAAAMSRM